MIMITKLNLSRSYKRITSLVLISILTLCYLQAYDLEIDGIYYNANINDMELTVTKGDNTYTGIINIPETTEYKGKIFTVVEIGSGAFASSNVEKVLLPSTIIDISSGAFDGCLNLQEVRLPEGLKTIGSYAFSGCRKLKEISIPSSVWKIGSNPFTNSGLRKAVIQDGENDISLNNVFEYTNLEYIYIGRDIAYNGEYRPFYKTFLAQVNIGPLVKKLPDSCFSDLKIWKITIPSNVIEIGRNCFNSTFLKELYLSDGEEPLKWGSSNMPNLNKLYYGRNVKSSYEVFSECKKIESVHVGEYISDFSSVLFNCDISTIYSLNPNPTAFLHSPFNSKTYLNAIVYVPKGSKEKYETTDGWKNFWEIKEKDFSSEGNLLYDSAPSFKVIKGGIECTNGGLFEIYTINGILIDRLYLEAGAIKKLQSQIYIISTNGKNKKS